MEIVRRFEFARLLIFSVEETEEDIHRAVSAGVRGYLPKSAPRPELLSAVRNIAAGRRFFPQPVLGKLQQRRSHVSLSAREIEVLQEMARGLPNKLIALQLGISTETVKTFVGRILEKLNAEDRTQAVMIALDRGLLRAGCHLIGGQWIASLPPCDLREMSALWSNLLFAEASRPSII
eukprot:gene19514-23913_t